MSDINWGKYSGDQIVRQIERAGHELHLRFIESRARVRELEQEVEPLRAELAEAKAATPEPEATTWERLRAMGRGARFRLHGAMWEGHNLYGNHPQPYVAATMLDAAGEKVRNAGGYCWVISFAMADINAHAELVEVTT